MANKTASSNSPIVILAVALLAVGVYSVYQGRREDPAPHGPDRVPRLQLLEHFRQNRDQRRARQHARDLSTICDAYADAIEFDDKQSEPRFRTGAQLAEARVALVDFRLDGWSYGVDYPTLGPAIKDFLDTEIGTAGGPVDSQQRQNWANAMRELAEASRYAANHL